MILVIFICIITVLRAAVGFSFTACAPRAPREGAVIDRGGDVVDVIPTAASRARARSLGASDLARVGALGTRGVVVGRSNRRATTPPWRPLSSSSARRRRGVIDRSHVREPAHVCAARGRRGDALGRRRARGRRSSRVRVGVAFDEERSEEGVHDVERAPEGGDERERARGDRAVARDVRHRARGYARSRRAVARGVESHFGEVRHTRT